MEYRPTLIKASEFLSKIHRGDKIIFEGEFLNGKKWNGKETDLDNEDGFEGEIVNGRRWNGKGKEIALWASEIEFDGEYINGVKKSK